MELLERFREEEKKRNEIARAYEEAEKEFGKVSRLEIRVQLLADGVELDDQKYENLVTEQIKVLCENIQAKVQKELDSAESSLKRILERKAATINQDFENTVQEMESAAKTQQAKPDVVKLDTTVDEEPKFTQPEQQLEETKDDSWKSKDNLYDLYINKGMEVKDIAAKCDAKKPTVYEYLRKYGLTELKKTMKKDAKFCGKRP